MSAATDTAIRCLEAGPLDSAAAASTERSLAAAGLQAAQWQTRRLPAGDAYLVYMGRFPDAAAAARKQDELHQLKLQATEVRNAPALQPGLSLGQYDSAAAADAALARFAQRGVRTARVVALPGQGPVRSLLRLPQADAAVQALAAAMALPGGKAFKACSADPRPKPAASGP